jgi:hypothetical protein
VFGPLFWFPAHVFAGIAAGIETNVQEYGMPGAAQRVLPRFVHDVGVSGVENIPLKGPVIIACNHPGAYDAIVAIANLPRQDIALVVSEVPLFKSMPALNSHLIYTEAGAHGRMGALRSFLRHLQQGGLVFIFPTGVVDPDPAFLPGAEQALERWSPSLELALRHVPQTRLVPAIVSGVLETSCLRSPLLRLQRERWRQQKLAEFLQVMQQILLKRDFGLTPHLSFGSALNADELRRTYNDEALMPAIIAHAKKTLADHQAAGPHDFSPGSLA